MKQGQSKEQWINDVLSSAEGIQRPAANPFLYEKIKYKMERGAVQVQSNAGRIAWGWAMALVVLLAVNGFSIVTKINHEKKDNRAEAAYSLMPDMNLQTVYNY